MDTRELELFYNYIIYKNYFYCLNYIENNIFSKNYFINNFNDFLNFVKKYNNKNCYINYNPLKSNLNRKYENIYGLYNIALDIEFINKNKPENLERLKILKLYIKKIIKKLKLKNYLLVFSGNGYHLYINLDKIIIKDIDILKNNYKLFIKKYLNKILLEISNNEVKLDDRKDLNGILRIPQTINISANRLVKIEDFMNKGKNKFIRKILFKYLNKKSKESKTNLLLNYKDLNIDLYEHPLVKIWLEPDLPDNVGKHYTLGFALQSLIFNLNLQNTEISLNLQNTINYTHNINLNLNYLSNYLDNLQILYITKNFAKQYYPKYLKEINKLINKLKNI